MTDPVEFVPWPKMPRWKGQGLIVTEKIDGTNAQVHVSADGRVLAGSRTRWLTPQDDNFGFAAWAEDYADELRTLGPGRHYGEWHGQGIQRGYGMTGRCLALFDTLRWRKPGQVLPACCSLVPVLYEGMFIMSAVDACMYDLRKNGSRVSPFMDPEGVCLFLPGVRTLFKYTFNGPKGQDKASS